MNGHEASEMPHVALAKSAFSKAHQTLGLLRDDACLVQMSYAEPAPRPMRDAPSKALDGP